MNKFLEKDTDGNWNTIPPVPSPKIKNVNCHKFVLYSIGIISWEEMVSDPSEQKTAGKDFTFGKQVRLISDLPYTLTRNEKELAIFAQEKCEIGNTYVGQILDIQTGEMTHSFLVKKESEDTYTCFDKSGFKYPFMVSDLNTILNFVNKDGEQQNKNQKWRLTLLESIKSTTNLQTQY